MKQKVVIPMSSCEDSPCLSAFIRRIYSFFCSSMAGVTVDLVVFQLLTNLGALAFLSNFCSSGLAIITTYMLVTRYTFKVAASFMTLFWFVCWYTTSIGFFSWAIQYVVTVTPWSPLVCKLASLPFSFTVNFLFSHFFLGKNNHD